MLSSGSPCHPVRVPAGIGTGRLARMQALDGCPVVSCVSCQVLVNPALELPVCGSLVLVCVRGSSVVGVHTSWL